MPKLGRAPIDVFGAFLFRIPRSAGAYVLSLAPLNRFDGHGSGDSHAAQDPAGFRAEIDQTIDAAATLGNARIIEFQS